MHNFTNDKQFILEEISSLDFLGKDVELNSINGGALNSSYCLEAQGRKYFVKTFESDWFAALDRELLFERQKKLADMGLSSKPVYLAKERGFQIDHWLELPTLTDSTLTELEKTKYVGKTLVLVHSLNISAPKLDLPKQWDYYLNLIAKSGFSMQNYPVQEYTQLWEDSCISDSCFCHNDLAFDHIVINEPPIIYDWEYSAISNRYFDIASCIAVNALNQTEEASLYAYYAQHAGVMLSEVVAKVAAMKPLVDFTNALWYKAASLRPS
jgi:thiamine kinase-like enzyme